MSSSHVPPCICERSKTTVECLACGANFKGRVRVTCAAHPSKFNLMDHVCCVMCRNVNIMEQRIKWIVQ